MSSTLFRKKEHELETTKVVISFDTAQTIAKALTTLKPGDSLEITALNQRVVIFCREMKIETKKKDHDETHLGDN